MVPVVGGRKGSEIMLMRALGCVCGCLPEHCRMFIDALNLTKLCTHAPTFTHLKHFFVSRT